MNRTDDPTLVKCADCGWEGRLMDCERSYIACPDGDVEPIDYCPECRGEVETLADKLSRTIDSIYERVRDRMIFAEDE